MEPITYLKPIMSNTDMTSQMLYALMNDITEPVTAPNIPISEQKSYLMRHINTVTIADRKSIGHILVLNNARHYLKPNAEGAMINLDLLPVKIIEQMYELLLYKMSKRAQ